MKTTEASDPIVNDTFQCAQCGRKLPARAPGGLCPACLLAAGTATGSGGDARPFVAPPLDEITALFPQLEVQRLLGAGGMGAVYLARQPALDRLVALKVLPAGGRNGAAFRERFNREARALARLSHPNIVAVHEFGEAGGLHYFVMEYVDGANLRQLQQAGRLSPRQALEVVPQICDALQYAHDEGVVHRDIKPENVLLDRRGRVKIADFGLAKIMEPEAASVRLTVEGQVMGTPHYMAPEQVERPLSVDHRADIYALGVVFYEMLTGDLPIGKFAPPSRKVEVDVRLDEIVLRALENDPERRYQQASEVKDRVATVVSGPAAVSADAVKPDADDEEEEDTLRPGEIPIRWLGIRVATERGGDREVYFQGAMAALFLTFAVGAVGEYLVRWITGGQHSLSRIAYLASLWTAIWGIRRALNRPLPEAPVVTEGGTQVVDVKRRWPYWGDALKLAGLFGFVIASHYVGVHYVRPWMAARNRGIRVEVKARADAPTGELHAALPGGGEVRLLAVSESGAAPNQWWLPNGVVRPGTLEVHDRPGIAPGDGWVRWMVFAVTNLPAGAGGPYFDLGTGGVLASGGAVYVEGRRLGQAQAVAYEWRGKMGRGSVRVGVATAPWTTFATHGTGGQGTRAVAVAGLPRWNAQVHALTDTAEGVTATILMPAETEAWRFQVVAIGESGGEIGLQLASASPTSSRAESLWTYTYPGVKAREIREIRLQARPVRWVEFAQIALSPSGPLPAPQTLVLGDTEELEVDELVDLDTLALGKFPPAEPGVNPLAAVGDGILWAQRKGFDAVAATRGLDMMNVECALVTDEEWGRFTAQDVADRVHDRPFAPQRLENPPDGKGGLYAFKTREGGMGLLRLDGSSQGRTLITVKRLRR